MAIATGSPTLATDYPAGAGALPKSPVIPQRFTLTRYSMDDILEFRKLPKYREPDWVTEKYVRPGILPSVEQRLPTTPMVLKREAMPDGIGQYGGVFRHTIGGRPQGWNWAAGHTQGWGGINYNMQQCLTRTGPMYQLSDADLRVMPNLATDWSWSEDRRILTMNLLQGAKWSDGDPFDAEDIEFLWRDVINDSNVAYPGTSLSFGEGTRLEIVNPYRIRWLFKASQSETVLYSMAYNTFCPAPSHILKPLHPSYNARATYAGFATALAPEKLPAVTMGAWVPVEYKKDDIIVMRRNPYYWKVDELGNQLPYMDEMHYRLATWDQRTQETILGQADFSNMENPPIYLTTLRKLAIPISPTRAMFGPRSLSLQLLLNQNKTLFADDPRSRAIRQLNRDIRFRRAISHAIDREQLGQNLEKGPFTAVYAGGLHPETAFYDDQTVVFYGYNTKLSRQYLAELGLRDTDGNGFVNFTRGSLQGQDLEIVLKSNNRITEVKAVDGLIQAFAKVGVKVVSEKLDDTTFTNQRDTGHFDFMLVRGEREWVAPEQRPELLAPIAQSLYWHMDTKQHPAQLQSFERQLNELILQFKASIEPLEKKQLMRRYNRIFTENLYHIGLVSYPGALLVNRRIKNVPAAPILAYQWAEDAVFRDRFWVKVPDQKPELKPETLAEY